MNYDAFHFLRPLWLIAIPAGLFLAYTLWRNADGVGDWRKACDAHLLPHLLSGENMSASKWPFIALALIWTLASVAMAGPAWERIEQPLYRELAPRVVVLDLSRSMDAADLKPSRLTRAKFKLADLLKASKDGQHALVVFAGDAFVVYPLTDDINTLLNLLPALNTEVVPVQGGNASRGLELAAELLDNASGFGDVVLITDGVDAAALSAAETIKQKGHALYVLAAGTEAGAPVRMAGGGFLKDAGGAIVLPSVNLTALEVVANAGGGRMVALTNDQTDISTLTGASMLRALNHQSKQTNYFGDLWRDAGVWLVLLLLPVTALVFRRGVLWLLILATPIISVISAINPQPVYANEVVEVSNSKNDWWQSLWQRPDQRAAAAFEKGDFERAAELSDDNLQRGAALFRLNQFDAAANVFASATEYQKLNNETAIAHYNHGNALAQQWLFEKALTAYNKALELNPEHEDAQFNREVVKRALEKKEQEQGQGGEEPEDGEQSEKNNEKENPGQTDQQQSQQEQQDSQSQQSENEEQREQDSREQAEQDVAQSSSEDQDQENMQETEDAKQSQADEQEAAGEQAEEQTPEDDSVALAQRESQGEIEQWLRRIPDDPGGLLRRKFLLQYKRRGVAPAENTQTW